MVKSKKLRLEQKIEEILTDPEKILKYFEALAYLGIAYYGYRAANHPSGAVAGIIGLKLATTMGGTPPVSQIAGLSILGAIGALNIRWNTTPSVEAQTPEEFIEEQKEDIGKIG